MRAARRLLPPPYPGLMRSIGRGAAAVVVATIVAVGCTTGGGSARPPGTFPGDEWEVSSPAELGLDEEVLDELAADAEAAGSDCFLVARDGRIALERYWRGTGPDDDHEVHSITKSITSTLVGIAADDGDLALEGSAADHIEAWQGTKAEAVTVSNLVRNDSGRERNLETDYLGLLAAPDRTAYAIGLAQQDPPGEVWAYNNSSIQTLEAVLSGATGVDPVDFAQERLFGPVGMDHTTLAVDASGGAALAFGARSTCRDLARLGLLIAERGRWDGEQVVSADWVDAATSPSTDLNEGYGYLWWLNTEGRIVPTALATSIEGDGEPTTGQQVPGAPEGLVWALGLGNQILQIDPDSGTVVVRLGREDTALGQDAFDEGDAARVVTDGVN